MNTAKRIEAAMEKYAPEGFDPASDDLTIPFAQQLVAKDEEIEHYRKALRFYAEATADDFAKDNGFNASAALAR